MDICETIKIKSSSAEQGEYIVINKADFNEVMHEIYSEDKVDETLTIAQLKERLTELGIKFPGTANKPELQKLLEESLTNISPNNGAENNP